MTAHSVGQDRFALARSAEVSRYDVKPSAISVVGLGYVGAVTVACLAWLGHRITGVDTSAGKVSQINRGQSPIVETGLARMLEAGVSEGRIEATSSIEHAVLETDMTLLSVGTPTAADGSCDLTHVKTASRAIGGALARKHGFHIVVLRCSVPPGTTLGVVATEIAAASGKLLGVGFGVAFNPEFLREGAAVADFFTPSRIVVGASDERTSRRVAEIYKGIPGEVVITSIAVAEVVKYVDNVWHATKVAFANEVGRLCKGLGVDSHDVMKIFVRDRKLNLSPYYLRPGFAFGGSCLPKEVRAVMHIAKGLGLDLPLVESLLSTNARHLSHVERLLAPFAGKRVGVLGLTFKPSTDDLRESPGIDLLAALHAAGWQVTAFDVNIRRDGTLAGKMAAALGARPSLAGFFDQLPGLLAETAGRLVEQSDVIVVTHAIEEYRRAIAGRRRGVHVLDLARLYETLPRDDAYEGIAW